MGASLSGQLRQLRLDPLSWLLPLLARLSCHLLFLHHVEVQILGFGALMSAVFAGRVLAGLFAGPLSRTRSQAHWLLALAFLLVGVSSRYVVLLLVCAGAGLQKDWAAAEPLPAKENPGGSVGSEAKRTLVFSSFAVIVSGVLYRENALLPCLYPGLAAAAFFGYFALSSLRGGRRRLTKFSAMSHQGAVDVERQQPAPVALQSSIRPEDVPVAEVPEAFLRMWGSQEKAHRKYVASQQWRQCRQMDTVLSRRSPFFFEILKYYPHAIHGRSRDGCVVLYEVLGRVRLPELLALGGSAEDLVDHMLLRNEYVFRRCFEPGHFGQIMTVVDVKGVRVSDFRAEVINFIKLSSEAMDSFYPGRVKRLVVCNAPYWFHSVWSMVASVLPESVNQKIRIIGDVRGLDDVIDPAQRPQEYGGSGSGLGSDPMHLGFLALAEAWGSETPALGSHSTQTPIRAAEVSEQRSPFYWFPSFGAGGSGQAFLGDKNAYFFISQLIPALGLTMSIP